MDSAIEAIKKRVSVRTYIDKPLERKEKEVITNLLKSNVTGPFGHQSRFELIDFSELDREEIKKLGTYGFIKGANAFIAGATMLQDKALEDFGYCLENIILKITNLGLGTCWMVGTFHRANFAGKMDIKEGEALIGISPVGYIQAKPSYIDQVVILAAGSRKRKPWDELFFCGNIKTPLSRKDANQYAIALEAVRLAPSGANIQPWRIIKEASHHIYHFYFQGTKGFDGISKDFKMAYIKNIDIGIAMCHFELSLAEIGIKGKWEIKSRGVSHKNMTYVASWMETEK